MFINITIEVAETRYDIRIDSEQKIQAGLSELQKKGKMQLRNPFPNYFHSRLNQKPVSAYKTFAEEHVFDGDILTAII